SAAYVPPPAASSSSAPPPPPPPSSGSGTGGWTSVPPPSAPYNSSIGVSGGGAPPANYHWGASLTEEAEEALTFLVFVDNILLDLLFYGSKNLTSGAWSNVYPQTITDSINTASAQAYVHRYTATDSLQHYQKPVPPQCKYSYPIQKVDDWVEVLVILLKLTIGTIIDIQTTLASTDPWLVPLLSSSLGTKARTGGLMNMMQNNAPAPAARESTMSPNLAYSYLWNNYVVPASCKDDMPYTVLPELAITKVTKNAANRAIGISVTLPSSIKADNVYFAWWSGYGKIEYTHFANGQTTIPADLYGYAWVTATNTTTATTMDDLAKSALSAPSMVWVSGPGSTAM
ncbi:hypothetical protein B7463_g10448, partial [Scytalidium lignicola]